MRPNSSKGGEDMMRGWMSMMQNMMGDEGERAGFNPMEMCKQMQETMNQIAKMAGYQNPEVQAMFEEWSMEIEKEILSQLKEKKEVDISSIATNIGISEESTLYFISKLIRDKKVQITGLKVIQDQ